MSACRSSAAQADGVETTSPRLGSDGTGDVVAVESLGRYTGPGPDERPTVSSCDIVEFVDDLIGTINTCAVEVDT